MDPEILAKAREQIKTVDQNVSAELLTAGELNVKFDVEGREQGLGYLSNKCVASEYGIVVIQEWWGLNKSICKTTDILAEQGFICLAPDIYRAKCATNFEEASHLMQGLDWTGAILDVNAAATHLRSLGCKKVGLVGFCMGGALAIATLTKSTNFDAAAPFYGIPQLAQYDLTQIKVPVFAMFAENDKAKGFSALADAQNFEVKCKEAGVNLKLKIWPEVEHAFMNQDSKNYHQETALQALHEVVAAFKTTFQV